VRAGITSYRPLYPRVPNQDLMYCSNACRQRAYRQRQRAKAPHSGPRSEHSPGFYPRHSAGAA
jgi:hypothetical protein